MLQKNVKDDTRLFDVAIVLVDDGYASTAVGPIEVFAAAGRLWNEMAGRAARPRFRVTTASIDGRPVASAYGLRLAPDRALDAVGPADLVLVSASGPLPEEFIARHARLPPWLAARHRRGALVAGVCSGVGFLAEAGLLDGRRATTHWGVAETFRQRYPEVLWQPDLLVTEDAGLFCGGGVNAASDLALYLVERLCGRDVALGCAKALILEMPRLHQSGYALLPLARPHADAKVRLLEARLQAAHGAEAPLEAAARDLGMSKRTLVRRFKAATGLMPGAYLQMLRVAAARRLLEDGAPSVDRVAEAVGYRDTAFFRRLFKRHTGLTPAAYRARFRPGAAAA